MQPGPNARAFLARYKRELKQGQHALISGPTGSGKTELASQLMNCHSERGAFTVAFICKLRPDETLVKSYRNWTRWKTWKNRPRPYDNRILLWPDVENRPAREALAIQRDVFRKAMDNITSVGDWSVYFDEGLHMCDPSFVGMNRDIAMAHALGRSANLSFTTSVQRPVHLPLILYGSASHVFVSNTTEESDLKRLSNLDTKYGRKQLEPMIAALPEFNFLWVNARGKEPPMPIDLAK